MTPLLKELEQEIQNLKHQTKILWIIFWLSTVLTLKLIVSWILTDTQDPVKILDYQLIAWLISMAFTINILIINDKFYIKKLKQKQLRYLYYTDPKVYSEQIKLNKEQD